MSDPAPFLLNGAPLEGKYRVGRFVAEGGFGSVYAGHQLRLDVPLAIKVLKTNRSLSTEARAEESKRFLDEAREGRGAHPGVAFILALAVEPNIKPVPKLGWPLLTECTTACSRPWSAPWVRSRRSASSRRCSCPPGAPN